MINVILARRSIRKFKSDSVSQDDLKDILNAAMNAPSAGNEQPWHFIIIDDRKTLDEIPKFHPYSQMIKEASVAILVCGDLKLEKHKGYWVQDCSAATENILLAVQSKNLGAVWLGVYPREDRVQGARKLLKIPEHVIPFSLIPIGYPAEKKPPGNRYDENKIHRNIW